MATVFKQPPLEEAVRRLLRDRTLKGNDLKFAVEAGRVPIDRWSLQVRQSAYFMLERYKGELRQNHGIIFEDIPRPFAAPGNNAPMSVVKEAMTTTRKLSEEPNQKTVIYDGLTRRYIIRFPYHAEMVQAVRASLPYPRYDPPTGSWSLIASPTSTEALIRFGQKYGFALPEFPQVFMTNNSLRAISSKPRITIDHEAIAMSKATDAELVIPGIGGELRPFQRAGVVYALAKERTFIGDEMGLGKTVQALAVLQAIQAFPAVIVCPASLKVQLVSGSGEVGASRAHRCGRLWEDARHSPGGHRDPEL